MNVLKRFLVACLLAFGPGAATAEDLPRMRAAMLTSGTVNWEISTILPRARPQERLRADGEGLADNGATRVAFEGGEAESWSRTGSGWRGSAPRGKDYVVIPYSKAVGGMVVKADSPAQGAGGPEGREDRHRRRAGGQELADPARLCQAGASTSPPRRSRSSARRR